MVSSTKQTQQRRSINLSRAARAQKRKRAKAGTPAFPIHLTGYDQNAPDAKKKG